MSAIGLSACGYIGIDERPLSGVGGANGLGGTSSGGRADASGGAPSGGTGAVVAGGAPAGGDTSASGGEGGEAGGSADGGSDGSGGASDGGSGSGEGSGGANQGDCSLSDPECAGLVQAMVNRYSFDGDDTLVIDSLGGESGHIHGTTLNGSGQLTLKPMLKSYVELPAGLISSLPNASFEVWFVWRGGDPWQKLFEFGDGDLSSSPVTYLFATPHAGGSDPANNTLTATLRHLGGGERQLRAGEFTEPEVLTQVVLIADDTNNRLTLYKNGGWLADLDTDVRLDGIRDDLNSVGRSLFPEDPYFNGDILDFRVYGDVLTAAMVAKSYELGADAVFPIGK